MPLVHFKISAGVMGVNVHSLKKKGGWGVEIIDNNKQTLSFDSFKDSHVAAFRLQYPPCEEHHPLSGGASSASVLSGGCLGQRIWEGKQINPLTGQRHILQPQVTFAQTGCSALTTKTLCYGHLLLTAGCTSQRKTSHPSILAGHMPLNPTSCH